MKIVIVTMVYTNRNVFVAGMDALAKTIDVTKHKHVFFDAHYPANAPIGRDYYATPFRHITMLDAGKNMGLHENANWVLRDLDPELADEDVVVFYDADEGAQQYGWLSAMEAVFQTDPKCGWLSLTAKPIHDVLDESEVPITEVAGVRLRVPSFCLMNLVCGWRVGALRKIGPLNEPHRWYGGLEVDAQPKFRAAGYWIGWLQDFTTQPFGWLQDESYTAYKKHHVGHAEPIFPGSFEEWLNR